MMHAVSMGGGAALGAVTIFGEIFICYADDMSNVIGERYQITIDKKVREQLGIKPGDRAIERVENGRLVVDFVPAPHDDSLLGALKVPGMPPITDWQALKESAWEARSQEILEVLRRTK
jgi:AbrB family looped-hinge helix DNA binding protein